MLKKFIAAMALVCVASPVQAGVFGSSLLQVTNERIEVSTNGGVTWRTANTNDFSGGVPGYSSTTFASLTGQPSVEFLAVPSPDGPIAYVSNAGGVVANNGAFVTGVPAGANPSYSLSDTDASGVLVDVLPPVPGAPIPAGATRDSVSSSQVDDAGLASSTNSSSSLTAKASISNTGVNTAGIYRYTADFMVNLTASVSPPPLDYTAQLVSQFQTTLTRTRPSGGTANDQFDPAQINKVLNATGNASYVYAGTLSSKGLAFAAGDTADFVVQYTTLASVSAANAAVPEPTSALIFGALGVAGLVSHRRRRRRQA